MKIKVFECPYCGARSLAETIKITTAREFSHIDEDGIPFCSMNWINELFPDDIQTVEFICITCGHTWPDIDAVIADNAMHEINEDDFAKWLEEEKIR